MHFLLFIIIAFLALWAWPQIFDDTPSNIPSKSSLAQLSGPEQKYYEQVFDYTMTAIDPEKSYSWETSSGSGAITAAAAFKSKSGATCRAFSESYVIGQTEHTDSGVACKREGRDGWCRLKVDDALTCAMEPPGGFVDETTRDSQDVLEGGKGVWGKIQNIWR